MALCTCQRAVLQGCKILVEIFFLQGCKSRFGMLPCDWVLAYERASLVLSLSTSGMRAMSGVNGSLLCTTLALAVLSLSSIRLTLTLLYSLGRAFVLHPRELGLGLFALSLRPLCHTLVGLSTVFLIFEDFFCEPLCLGSFPSINRCSIHDP